MAIDQVTGRTYVTDYYNHIVQEFVTIDNVNYSFDSAWGTALTEGDGFVMEIFLDTFCVCVTLQSNYTIIVQLYIYTIISLRVFMHAMGYALLCTAHIKHLEKLQRKCRQQVEDDIIKPIVSGTRARNTQKRPRERY